MMDFKQINFINTIFETFNNHNIEYCVLRNYENLPYDIGNDIDFLIDQYQKEKIVNLLGEISLNHNYKLVRKVERFGYLGLFYIDPDKGNIIALDLLTKSVKQCFEYANSDFILRNRVVYKNFYIPKKGSMLYTIFFKDLLTYGRLRDKNNLLFQQMVRDDKEDFIGTGEAYFSQEILDKVYEDLLFRRETINRSTLYKALFMKIKITFLFSFIFYRLKDLLSYNLYWRWV